MKLHSKTDTIILLLSDARGIYIPRDFVCDDQGHIAVKHCNRWHIRPEDRRILKNPDHDLYWDVWDSVLNKAFFLATESDDSMPGKWFLYQDGDLFAYHESHEWGED